MAEIWDVSPALEAAPAAQAPATVGPLGPAASALDVLLTGSQRQILGYNSNRGSDYFA